MAHFAKVENGIVTEVIVASGDVINSGEFGDPSKWIKTSYNTRENIYWTPNTYPAVKDPDQSKALRGNYAGINFIYDSVNDVFYAPSPFPSWVLNTSSWTWQAPVPRPNDGKLYEWDEQTLSWIDRSQ